jgi:glycosyltransferase involved in cell wall biosynthesis
MGEVRKFIDLHHLDGSVILPGLVPQKMGPHYLAACDILASPHVPNPDGTKFFGSPTKLFEYMAMGKGIVASELDQIGEILEHAGTAWMVRPGDADALVVGLKMLVDNVELRHRLGAGARQKAVAEHSWLEHTRRIVARLTEVAGHKCPGVHRSGQLSR